MDKLWTRAVRLQWYDPKKANEYVINGYTKPLRCKDWEQALLEFMLALLISPSVGMQQQAPLTQRLKEVTCPVLVITGDTDRLVPAWNAKRLANALPQAKFSLIKECGHLPHEETPDEFLALVKDFFSQIVSTDAKTETSFAPT
jgi:pimeloyl-ACP methyl ester carboxylesterase